MADEDDSPSVYDYYLDLLGSWPTSIALPSLWFCTFNFDNVKILNTLNQSMDGVEKGWDISDNTVKFLTTTEGYKANMLMGCVFVKEVSTPQENINIKRDGLNYGGFINPATASERRKDNRLSVVFLETNSSFVDFVIRPWLVLTSYYGLIARKTDSPKNLKCSSFDSVFLSKMGKSGNEEKIGIRKIISYENVVPFSIEETRYTSDKSELVAPRAYFSYDRYTVREKKQAQREIKSPSPLKVSK